MEKDFFKLAHLGTGDWLDPLKPKKMNTLKSRVATACTFFEKYIKMHPGGFMVDKSFLLGFLRREKITGYARKIFKQYGFRLRVYSKKPFVHVRKWKPKK